MLRVSVMMREPSRLQLGIMMEMRRRETLYNIWNLTNQAKPLQCTSRMCRESTTRSEVEDQRHIVRLNKYKESSISRQQGVGPRLDEWQRR